MTKTELEIKTAAVVETTHAALTAVFEALNQGQQKKLLKDKTVAAIFVRCGVINPEQVEEVSDDG